MKIIRTYVLKDVVYVFLSTLFILTALMVSGNVLRDMADLVMNWGVDFSLLVRLFVYSTPFLFGFTIPTAFLISVLLVFGKLSSDQELNALKASGVSLRKIIHPVLLLACALSLFVFYNNDRVATQSHFRVRQITTEIGMKAPAAMLEEGVFIKQFKNIVLFIHRIQMNHLTGIRIYQPQPEGPTRIIVAEKGELITIPEQNLIKLKLMNGTTDEPDPDNPEKFYKLRFDTYTLPLDLSEYKFNRPLDKKRKEMSVMELWREYTRIKSEFDFIANDLVAEIHKRISMSFACIIFALVGIPLAIQTKRSEKSIGCGYALVLTTLYWTIMMGASAMAKTGTIPPYVALYTPTCIFFVIGGMLVQRALRH